MNNAVKQGRRYDATRRQVAARETRRAILDAARNLFLEHGYVATTMPAIATQAQVAVDTVYASCGRKPEILRILIEHAISGSDETIPALQRDYVRAMRAESDPRRKLIRYARAMREIQGRLAPLVRVLLEAAPSDASLEALWTEISQRRAANMRLLVEDLATTSQLRDGLSVDEAADVIWATNSPEFYMLLVDGRGWSPERFEGWQAQTWITLLLAPAHAP